MTRSVALPSQLLKLLAQLGHLAAKIFQLLMDLIEDSMDVRFVWTQITLHFFGMTSYLPGDIMQPSRVQVFRRHMHLFDALHGLLALSVWRHWAWRLGARRAVMGRVAFTRRFWPPRRLGAPTIGIPSLLDPATFHQLVELPLCLVDRPAQVCPSLVTAPFVTEPLLILP